MQGMLQTAEQTDTLIIQETILASYMRAQTTEEDSCRSEEEDGPGKGKSRTDTKSVYAKRPAAHAYTDIRNVYLEVKLFEKTVHL